MFLKNKNIIFKIRRSKVTDYAALIIIISPFPFEGSFSILFKTVRKTKTDPDQMARFETSDVGLNCLSLFHKRRYSYIG